MVHRQQMQQPYNLQKGFTVDINRNVKAKVQVGAGVLVGKGSLVIETIRGNKYIREVMLVLEIAENLLSVGQMTEHGYFLLF